MGVNLDSFLAETSQDQDKNFLSINKRKIDKKKYVLKYTD